MYDTSDDDEEDFTVIGDPIVDMRTKIIENISVFNYIPLVVNVLWVVENWAGNSCDDYIKIALCCRMLESYQELRQLKDIHYSVVESMYKLSENRKLEYIRKKKSWFQYIYSFIG